MRRRIATAAAIAMALFILPAVPAVAMDEPESVSLSDIMVYQDLITDGDALTVVPYSIPFGTLPDDPINETFIFRMLTSGNITEVGSILAYPYYNYGYGSGVVSFYLESGIVWEGAYTFRVQESPVHYPSPQYWDFEIGASNYSSDDDQAAALRSKIIDVATSLTAEYSLDLLSTDDAGNTILSTYGEMYFQNAISGLALMCPALFSFQTRTPDYTSRSWDYTIAEAMLTKYEGTFIYDFMTGYAGLFSMETPAAMNFLSIILFVVLIFVAVKFFKGTTMSSFMDGYAFLILLMLDGFFSMILAGFIAFILAVTGGIILLFNRS